MALNNEHYKFLYFFSSAMSIAVKYHEESDIPMVTFANLVFCMREEVLEILKCFLRTLDYRMYFSDKEWISSETGLILFVGFATGIDIDAN